MGGGLATLWGTCRLDHTHPSPDVSSYSHPPPPTPSRQPQALFWILLQLWFRFWVWRWLAIFWDVAACGLVGAEHFTGAYCLHRGDALMMVSASTSETSLIMYQTTRRNIPEHNCLCTIFLIYFKWLKTKWTGNICTKMVSSKWLTYIT